MCNRRQLARVSVLLLSALFSVVLLEASYRFYLFGLGSLSVEKMNSLRPIGESGMIKRSVYPEIAFDLKPNLSTYFKLARVETNSRGLRDREYDLTKPERTFRVAVLGDSFTMPAGVDVRDSYHKVLERKLNLTTDSLSYEFINFGVGGYSLRQY